MATESVVWASSLVLAIPNNSDQSDLHMVTCVPKSHAKLIGVSLKLYFDFSVTDDRRYSSFLLGKMFFVSLSSEAEKSLYSAVPRYLFNWLKSRVS